MVQVISSVSQKSHYPPHFLTHSSRSRANFFRTYILWDRLDDPPARLDNFATPSICCSIKTIVTLHLECWIFFWRWKAYPISRSHPPPPTGNLLPTRDQIYPHRYSEAFSLTHLSLWIPRRFACRSRLCYPYTSPPNCFYNFHPWNSRIAVPILIIPDHIELHYLLFMPHPRSMTPPPAYIVNTSSGISSIMSSATINPNISQYSWATLTQDFTPIRLKAVNPTLDQQPSPLKSAMTSSKLPTSPIWLTFYKITNCQLSPQWDLANHHSSSHPLKSPSHPHQFIFLPLIHVQHWTTLYAELNTRPISAPWNHCPQSHSLGCTDTFSFQLN